MTIRSFPAHDDDMTSEKILIMMFIDAGIKHLAFLPETLLNVNFLTTELLVASAATT